MAQNNHTFIDILKIDIEGAEFEALEALIDAYPSATSSSGSQTKVDPAEQGWTTVWPAPIGGTCQTLRLDLFPKFLLWWEKLERAGLRPFWTEPNLVYINLVRGSRPDWLR